METKLGVLNGKTRGNLKGNVINLGYHGCSTVYLVLVSEKTFIQSHLIQYLSFKDSNLFSDHRPILLCLNAKLGDISNTGDNYPDQNILLFEKPETFLWRSCMKDEFSKELYLTAGNRSILPTSNTGSDPKSQLSIDNVLENIED